MKNIKFTHVLIVLAIAGLAYYLWNESKKKEEQEQSSAGTDANNSTSGSLLTNPITVNPLLFQPTVKPFVKPALNKQVSGSMLLKN